MQIIQIVHPAPSPGVGQFSKKQKKVIIFKRYRTNKYESKLAVIRSQHRQKFNQDYPGKGNYDKELNEKKLLNKNLLSQKDASEFMKILKKQEGIMDSINVSTAAVVMSRDILPISKNRSDANQLKNIDAVYIQLCYLIMKHVNKMNERSVSNSLWSLGKAVDILGPEKIEQYKITFENLCSRAVIISNYMRTQGTANTLWSMAKFQFADYQKIRKIVQQAIRATRKEYVPQNISNILWAMATLKYEDLKALQHFVKIAKNCIHDMNGQAISNLLWALQQLRFYDKELNLEVENIIINSDKKFNNQSIANFAMAFTDFGLEQNNQICEILVEQFVSNKFSYLQDQSTFLYALAWLECPQNLAQKAADRVLEYNQNNLFKNFKEIQFTQIRQAQIYYNIKGQKLLFPTDFENKCKKELQACVLGKIMNLQNAFLDTVFTYVQGHFNFAAKNVLIYEDQIEIHIALQLGEKNKVAVRVNNKSVFFINCPEKLMGRCQRQVFLLQQLGWCVIQVSSLQWEKNPQYQQELVNTIQDKLKQTSFSEDT